MSSMVDASNVKIMVVVKLRSRLAADEIKRRFRERMPEFRQQPGLIQKYYVYEESSGEWGGIYLWDSKESAEKYLASDLRKSIAAAYEAEGAPHVDTFSVIEPLRS
jgi:heme-degrading monooxygenase HmoA